MRHLLRLVSPIQLEPVRVLTAADVPGAKNHGVIRRDWPVLAYDKVRYIGDALAVVVAESEEIAAKALDLIQVDYQPLPDVGFPAEALAEGAPLLHESGNLLKHIVVNKGDLEAGFAQAYYVTEREYNVPSADHAFLEPEAGVARLDEEGNVLVYVGSQIPFGDREQIAQSLGLPLEKVRVIQTPEEIPGPPPPLISIRITIRRQALRYTTLTVQMTCWSFRTHQPLVN